MREWGNDSGKRGGKRDWVVQEMGQWNNKLRMLPKTSKYYFIHQWLFFPEQEACRFSLFICNQPFVQVYFYQFLVINKYVYYNLSTSCMSVGPNEWQNRNYVQSKARQSKLLKILTNLVNMLHLMYYLASFQWIRREKTSSHKYIKT